MRCCLPLSMASLFALAGCGPPPTPSSTFSALNPTLIQPTCGKFDSCHSAHGKMGGLDLQTDPYHALVDAATQSPAYPKLKLDYPMRVVPGDPDHSAVWIKLNMSTSHDVNYGYRMPQSQLPLDAGSLAAWKGWISAGALDD